MYLELVDIVTEELLVMQPLIFRSVRRKLQKAVLADFYVDITPMNLEIMKLLERKESLSISEIGDQLQIARAQMTRLVDKLVTTGLAERQSGTDDRRIIYINLTEKGMRTIQDQDKLLKNAFKETLQDLSEDELNEIKVSLIKLRDIFSKTLDTKNNGTANK